MTRWQALREAGWIAGIDFVIMTVLGLFLLTGAYWSIFGSPTTLQVISLLLGATIILLLWIVILIFRCMDFVLSTQADINLMPDAAARMAVLFMRGQGKQ